MESTAGHHMNAAMEINMTPDPVVHALLDLVKVVGNHPDVMFEGHPLNAAFIKASDVLRTHVDPCGSGFVPPEATKPLDRSEAVNLARNYLDRDYPPLTPHGVKTLAEAVMAMDAYISARPEGEALSLLRELHKYMDFETPMKSNEMYAPEDPSGINEVFAKAHALLAPQKSDG